MIPDPGFSLYPNPTTGEVQINAAFETLTVHDLTGKRVLQLRGDFEAGQRLDMSTLERGLYLVQIKDNSGNMQTTKLVKL